MLDFDVCVNWKALERASIAFTFVQGTIVLQGNANVIIRISAAYIEKRSYVYKLFASGAVSMLPSVYLGSEFYAISFI